MGEHKNVPPRHSSIYVRRGKLAKLAMDHGHCNCAFGNRPQQGISAAWRSVVIKARKHLPSKRSANHSPQTIEPLVIAMCGLSRLGFALVFDTPPRWVIIDEMVLNNDEPARSAVHVCPEPV